MKETIDPLALKSQLCFPLYACAKEVVRRYTPLLDALGLTYTQYIAMMVLWESQQVTVKELGERLYLDSGTLTPLLKKMERQGLVSRARSAVDERSVIITLTEQGAALRARALEVPAHMASCINLSPEEARTLYGLLHKVLGQVTQKEDHATEL